MNRPSHSLSPPGEGQGEGNTPRFMVRVQFRKELGASHEPSITFPLPPGEGQGEGILLRFMARERF
jgi:hypothetical protein